MLQQCRALLHKPSQATGRPLGVCSSFRRSVFLICILLDSLFDCFSICMTDNERITILYEYWIERRHYCLWPALKKLMIERIFFSH